MFKFLFTLLMTWILISLIRKSLFGSSKPKESDRAQQSHRQRKPEGTTTVTRVNEPPKKIVDSNEAEYAEYEEIE